MNSVHADATVLALMLLAACSGGEPPTGAACCAEKPATTPASEASIYHLESRWRDGHGQPLRLGDLAGRVQVIAMMFTRCEYACPRTLADLRAIEAQLEPDASVGFVLVSFDSERDQPDVLAAYARDHSLASDAWTLLHGSASDVRELAAVLGVQYEKTPAGGFSHSNLITVLNTKGEIVHQQNGLGGDPAPTLAQIRVSQSARR